MMRRQTIAIAIFFSLAVPAFSETDETQEPPLELTVSVNGKPMAAMFGKEITIKGEFINPKIVVQPASVRKFNYGGISFDYPANFTWESEINAPEYRNWTLSGNDSKIMYFIVNSAFTPDVYAAGMVVQFGVDNITITPISRKFGNETLKGKRVTIFAGENEIVQDAFELPAIQEQRRLLILQDTAPELTPDLAEPKLVLSLFSKSFVIHKETD